jgi:hypothetical protein
LLYNLWTILLLFLINLIIIKKYEARYTCLRSVIPSTREAETRNITVWGKLRQKVSKSHLKQAIDRRTNINPYIYLYIITFIPPFIPLLSLSFWRQRVGVVAWFKLYSKCKVLSLISSTNTTPKKKGKERKRKDVYKIKFFSLDYELLKEHNSRF